MRILIALTITSITVLMSHVTHSAAKTDWLNWRGPDGNGVATAGQKPPVEWDTKKNVIWKVAVPGRGHSSPTLVGNRVILTTADEGKSTQSVLCFDRTTGKSLWKTEVNRGELPPRIHRKNTHATPSVASDGERLFATFNNHGNVQLIALDLDGKKLWHRSAGPYRPGRYKYGYAPSPVLYKSLVIVASECDADAYLAAFDQKTGREVWRTDRPKEVSYSSPVITNIDGRDQLLICGCSLVAGYNPADGKQLWSAPGISSATCGTMVWDGNIVFVSGGYPRKGTFAVRLGPTPKRLWENPVKCYEQSLIAHNGYVYAMSDGGVAFCWEAKTGRRMWTQRLGGGATSASPVIAGGNIYVTNERGTTFVFQANPRRFVSVGRNQLGTAAFATPTISADHIYHRTAEGQGGQRQEYLYCIGK